MVTVARTPDGVPSASRVGESPGGSSAWRGAWPAVLIAVAFAPMLAMHARSLWSRPHYQFFPLLVPGAAALVYRSCRRLGPLEPGSASRASWVALFGWVLLAASVALVSNTLAMVAALVTLHAAIHALGGKRLVWATLPAFLFLCLAVPPPRHLDAELVSRLQAFVSRCSSGMLDAAHVFHMMEGNVVEVSGQKLLVDQACSGIYSLFTLLLGTFFFALWVRASIVRTVFLLAAAVAWVLLGNIARIVSIVLLSTRWGIDATTGWKHEAIGLAIFVGMLAMMASTDRIYGFVASVLLRLRWAIFVPKRPKRAGQDEFTRNLSRTTRGGSRGRRRSAEAPPAPAPTATATATATMTVAAPTSEVLVEELESAPTELPPPGRTWLGSWVAAAGFGVLLVPQFLMPGVNWKEVLLANDFYVKAFDRLDLESLPKSLGTFERLEFKTSHREMDDSWGEHSRSWYYRAGNTIVGLSLDYQFVDWHDLTLCYTGQGWRIEGTRIGLGASGDREARTWVDADFKNLEGRRGYLIFGLFDRTGRSITPPQARGVVQSMGSRLRSWFIRSSQGKEAADGLNYQFQVFVESDEPLPPAARQELLALFRQARETVQSTAFPKSTEGPSR